MSSYRHPGQTAARAVSMALPQSAAAIRDPAQRGPHLHVAPPVSSSGLTGRSSIHQSPGMDSDRHCYVYILSSGIGGTLYIGVTNDLVRRVYEHKTKSADGFTNKHDVDRLVYYEPFEDVETAIRREKRLKRYNRGWKISLIEEQNPNWIDLYPSIAKL